MSKQARLSLITALVLLSGIALWNRMHHEGRHPNDIASGRHVEIHLPNHDCLGDSCANEIWEKVGKYYRVVGVTGTEKLPAKLMVRLRAAVLESKDTQYRIAQFREHPAPLDIERRVQELFPWLEVQTPRLSKAQVDSNLRQYLKQRVEFSEHVRDLRVDLGGEPPIILRMANPKERMKTPAMGHLGPPPNWSVKVGKEEWETCSFKINEYLSPWVYGYGSTLEDYSEWPLDFVEVKARELAAPHIEEHIRSSYLTWPGSERFGSDFSLSSVTFATTFGPYTKLRVGVLKNSHYSEIELRIFPTENPKLDWNEVWGCLEGEEKKGEAKGPLIMYPKEQHRVGSVIETKP